MSDNLMVGSDTGLQQNSGIMRYAFGTALIMSVVLAYQWPLSHLLPVLALGFLGPDKRAPSLKQAIGFILIVGIACGVGVLLGSFAQLPFVLLPLTALLLFHIFYAKATTINPFLKTWLVIAVLLLPMMNLLIPSLAIELLKALVLGSVASILLAWLVFALFPASKMSATEQKAVTEAAEMDQHTRFKTALNSTLIIMPLLTLFYLYKWTGGLIMLIFVGILSMQPSSVKGSAVGKALIIGNSIGAILAILVYNLFTVVPNLIFAIAITLLVGLVLGKLFFAGKKASPLFNMGFSTFLLLIGSMTQSSDESASGSATSRVLLIMLAVVYVATAYTLIENWGTKNKTIENIKAIKSPESG